MTKVKLKKCRRKGCDAMFKPFKSTDKYCSLECAKLDAKPVVKKAYKINRRSKKGMDEDRQYFKKRKVFLSLPGNDKCFVDGCNNKASTVEHVAGRIGKNYLDESTWQPCCSFHNCEFERNTELSNKYQLSKFHDGKKIIK